MKKIIAIFILVLMIFSMAACKQEKPAEIPEQEVVEDTKEENKEEKTVSDIIADAKLQYPTTNELFRYTVYDTYVAITEYIGPEGADVVVPSRLDNLPVYVVGIGSFKKNINSLVFEEGISILNGCASSNLALKSVTIPGTVSSFYNAFKDCLELETVVIQEGVKAISFSAFEKCSKLSQVTIPSTVTDIQNSAFVHCKALRSITLPEGLLMLGASAFFGTGLETFEIPESVSMMSCSCVNMCENLKTIIVHNGSMSINLDLKYSDVVKLCFTGCPSDLVVYGKPGSTIAIQCADEGVNFKVIE